MILQSHTIPTVRVMMMKTIGTPTATVMMMMMMKQVSSSSTSKSRCFVSSPSIRIIASMRNEYSNNNNNNNNRHFNKRFSSSSTSSSSSSSSSSPPSPPPITTVGIIGLGLMGHGIAQVTAQSPITQRIIAYEMQESFLHRGQERITTSLNKLVSKQTMTPEEMTTIQNKIHYTTNIQDLQSCDLVIEAVIEDMTLKQDLYTKLSTVCDAKTILASNTSSLSITELSHCTNRPQSFMGIHFFNPVQIMKLVEVIPTSITDPIVYDRVYQFIQTLPNKIPVTCKNDTPGFIVNRLLVPFLLSAMSMVDRNDASISDIDTSMMYGAGHPMGPLHLADYIGLDTCHNIIAGWVHKYPQEPSFVIPTILERMIQNQHYGRKSGRGFYHWDGDQRGNPVEL